MLATVSRHTGAARLRLSVFARAARLGRRAALALPLLAIGASAHAEEWLATKTKALPLKLDVVRHALPANKPMHVIVALKLRDADGLKTFLKNQHTAGSPQFGVTMTPEQFTAAYGPTTDSVKQVTDYLAAAGFRNITVSSNRTVIQADGSAKIAQAAFNTRLARFTLGGKPVFAPISDVMVPKSLSGTVLSVLGLQNVTATTTHTATKAVRHADDLRANTKTTDAAGAPTLVEAYPNDAILKAYDAGTTPTGSGTTLAISTAGTDLLQVINDLRVYEKDANLPQVPVSISQVAPIPDPQETDGDGEWDLDSQTSTGIAGAVKKVVFYNATDLGDSLLLAYNQFVTDNVAKVGNMSYGGCENLQALLGGLDADDQAFAQAVAQGQTWFASSGDAGAACSLLLNIVTPDFGVPSSVEYPASSPYVVAVGGTTLVTDADYNYITETAWDAGGGGTSVFEEAPAWQQNDAAIPVANTLGLRAVPDVAMVAGGPDVGSPVGFVGFGGADIVSNGAHGAAVGTSWSSPLAAGVWARMQSARCDTLSFAPPYLYALDTTQQPLSTAAGFNDILLGTNGEFVAAPGWDYTTGYGTFDITKLNAALPAPPASCVQQVVKPPVAKVTASATQGPTPLAVVFDASKSTDPSKLAIVDYSIDFGDGTYADQAGPKFPPHTYAQPGTYTVSVRATNAKGGVSAPATTTVSPFGQLAACTADGDVILTSAAGNAQVAGGVDAFAGADDLLSTAIKEPADQDGKLVFVTKVSSLSTVPPLLKWVTYFDVQGRTEPNAEYYFVEMTTSNGTPQFLYGTHGYLPGPEPLSTYTVLGKLDATSTYTADGTITLVLDKSKLQLATGTVLTSLYSSIRTATPQDTTGTIEGGVGLTQDSAGAALPYTIAGNAVCGPNTAPVAQMRVGTTVPEPGANVRFIGRNSTDANAGDSVTHFLFDFGDGTSTGWTSESSVTHVYANAGAYDAKLTVADSRGLQSTNAAHVAMKVGHSGIDGLVDDSYTVRKNIRRAILTPMQNDTINGKGVITAVSAPSAGGAVTIISSGARLSYVPKTGFTGDETFTYTVTAGGATGTATVTMHVQ